VKSDSVMVAIYLQLQLDLVEFTFIIFTPRNVQSLCSAKVTIKKCVALTGMRTIWVLPVVAMTATCFSMTLLNERNLNKEQ